MDNLRTIMQTNEDPVLWANEGGQFRGVAAAGFRGTQTRMQRTRKRKQQEEMDSHLDQ